MTLIGLYPVTARVTLWLNEIANVTLGGASPNRPNEETAPGSERHRIKI